MKGKKLARRDFLKCAGLAAPLILGNASALAMGKTPVQTHPYLIKPVRLQFGDVLAIVAPASAPDDPADIDRYAAAIENRGFKPKLAPNVRKRLGFLSGDDQSRADDLMAMFADPEVKGIICARGGYGSARLLRMLDYHLIKQHPKVFIGFSDITALHSALQIHSQLVTFHGPTLNTEITSAPSWEFSVQSLLKTVMQPSAPGGICDDNARKAVKILRGGIAKGPLVGGNLSMLASLMGTPYQPRFKDAIFFFEDVDEEPYRFDARLTQLLNAGLLQQAAGVAVGTNKNCEGAAAASKEYHQTLEDVLKDRLLPLGVPVVTGLPFGHVPNNATLPLGLEATLDAANGDLVIDEAAVV
ncbi:MAG TPA: LD-carboxypeptidase [Candidatus Acidoferrum sp.]|nr:LD-carboxypeptidase [Candidatus Acidoferrum sp.]